MVSYLALENALGLGLVTKNTLNGFAPLVETLLQGDAPIEGNFKPQWNKQGRALFRPFCFGMAWSIHGFRLME